MRRKQNLTLQLDVQVIRKAKILATRRGTSISALVAAQIERIVGENERYEFARRRALELLAEGFHLGGRLRVKRDELHDRQSLRRH